jgi:hypothetical protein
MSRARWGSGGDPDTDLREHLLALLEGGGAHVTFERAVEGLAPDLRGRRVEGLPYSPWQILEHLRIAQRDILEFSRAPDWASPDWPDGYWPQAPEPPADNSWDESVEAFQVDLSEMADLIRDPANDLHAPLPWGDGQTLLREALLVADHNAYHLGELVVVRRLLGAW